MSLIALAACVRAGGQHTSNDRDLAFGAFTRAEIDKPVEPLPGNPPPRYPAKLRNAFIDGEVVVRFIVDTNGIVERNSIRVIRSTDSAFSRSVREFLLSARFSPAELRGKKVRQLVEQPFNFHIR